MGGSRSEEFLAPCESGEDTYVRSSDGTYAANVEAVVTPVPESLPFDDAPVSHVEATPDTPTIESLVDLANSQYPRTDGGAWTAADTLKNVVLMLTALDGSTEPLVIGVPGDREVDMKRVEAAVFPAEPRVFEDADFARYPSLVRGYIGPQVLGEESASGIRYLVDPRVVTGTRWITGANVAGHHVFDLVAGRDFTPDGTIEAAEVRDGDQAPDGSGTLVSARGIEIGHIFQLGTKYAEALDLKVLDENGKQRVVTMGSYGVGVSRAVAAVAEQTYDDLGLCWPRAIAPVDVHVLATGKDEAAFAEAERIAAELTDQGLDVLIDDRPKVSPGVKFKDAELLGIPTIVVVGKGLAEGVVEVRDRRTGDRQDLEPAAVVDAVIAQVRG
jgi:prolyl-tRNA synthetase